MGKSGGKTTKGGKTMNPTDAFRKELRKKELKRNKKERKKIREVGILKKDPETLRDQISKLESMKADGALDKARKHKKRQLEDTLNLVLKKRKEYEEKMKEKGETPVMFSHLGPVRKHSTVEEESKHPKPEDSVYYHPTLNPSGAPPPGKPSMYKSSVGSNIPLQEASSSNAGSSLVIESEDGTLLVPPSVSPPPLPPLEIGSGDSFVFPESLPSLPPLPSNEVTATVLLPPPPPPGPPPKELLAFHTQFPPPSTIYQSMQPPHPGVVGDEEASDLDDLISMDSVQVLNRHLPPPPPPPVGLPANMDNNHLNGPPSETTSQLQADERDAIKAVPPPLPPAPLEPLKLQPYMPGGAAVGLNSIPNLAPQGFPRFPLPPPPPMEMQPLSSVPGIGGQSIPSGTMFPLYPRPPFGPPPGYMMRPPLPPGPPPPQPHFHQEELMARPPPIPPKPSYVKSAAATVVKRPLAQHTPELTAMVPASVRVRRESAQPKPKPKSLSSLATSEPSTTSSTKRPETSSSSSTQKSPSIDDLYMTFLKDIKALGALDS